MISQLLKPSLSLICLTIEAFRENQNQTQTTFTTSAGFSLGISAEDKLSMPFGAYCWAPSAVLRARVGVHVTPLSLSLLLGGNERDAAPSAQIHDAAILHAGIDVLSNRGLLFYL